MLPPRHRRFVLMISDEEEMRIQNFRFANRISSKAYAARTLIDAGLKALTGKLEEAATGNRLDAEIPAAAETRQARQRPSDATREVGASE